MNFVTKPLIALAALTMFSATTLAGSNSKSAGSGALTEEAAVQDGIKKEETDATMSGAMGNDAMKKDAEMKDGETSMAKPAAMMKKETKRGSGDN